MVNRWERCTVMSNYYTEEVTPGETIIRFRSKKKNNIITDTMIRNIKSLLETKAFSDEVRYEATLIKNSEESRKVGKSEVDKLKEELDTILNIIELYNKYPYYGYNFVLVSCKEEQYSGWYMLYTSYRQASADEIIYLTNKLYKICDSIELDIQIE